MVASGHDLENKSPAFEGLESKILIHGKWFIVKGGARDTSPLVQISIDPQGKAAIARANNEVMQLSPDKVVVFSCPLEDPDGDDKMVQIQNDLNTYIHMYTHLCSGLRVKTNDSPVP